MIEKIYMVEKHIGDTTILIPMIDGNEYYMEIKKYAESDKQLTEILNNFLKHYTAVIKFYSKHNDDDIVINMDDETYCVVVERPNTTYLKMMLTDIIYSHIVAVQNEILKKPILKFCENYKMFTISELITNNHPNMKKIKKYLKHDLKFSDTHTNILASYWGKLIMTYISIKNQPNNKKIAKSLKKTFKELLYDSHQQSVNIYFLKNYEEEIEIFEKKHIFKIEFDESDSARITYLVDGQIAELEVLLEIFPELNIIDLDRYYDLQEEYSPVHDFGPYRLVNEYTGIIFEEFAKYIEYITILTLYSEGKLYNLEINSLSNTI